MTEIIYIEHDGTAHRVDVAPGLSVMTGAVHNDVPGIDADCGGACACATCHVYVDEAWVARTGAASSAEAEMLEFTTEVRANSRLSCQIVVSAELDGLVVRLPRTQH